MKSATRGKHTDVEVTNVSGHGLWLLMEDRERFICSEQFGSRRPSPLVHVTRPAPHHLWPDFDVTRRRVHDHWSGILVSRPRGDVNLRPVPSAPREAEVRRAVAPRRARGHARRQDPIPELAAVHGAGAVADPRRAEGIDLSRWRRGVGAVARGTDRRGLIPTTDAFAVEAAFERLGKYGSR